MKRFHRFTAAAMACALTVLTCIHSSDAAVKTEAVDEQSLKYAEIVINAVNDIRVANGLRELAITPVLLDCSDIRAADLTESFSHYRPDGSTCFTVLKSAGVSYSFVAENIAAGRSDPVATVQQWMDSEGHKENILSDTFTHIGVGYAYDADSTYVHYWGMFLIGVYDGTEPYIYDDQYIPTRELGDPNGTKSINSADASVILEYAAADAVGMDYPVVRAFDDAADINGDGSIDSIDASIILTYTAAKGSGEDVKLSDFIW